MRRALTVLAGAVLALLPLGVAQAQPPAPTAIDVVNECGKVTLTFTGPGDAVSGTHGFRWNAVNGSVSTGEGLRTGTVEVAADGVETVDIAFPEDEFGGIAAVTVTVIYGPNTHLQPRLDIYPVDTDCAPPATETPAPTTTPTTTPAPTTSVTATPDPSVTPTATDPTPIPEGQSQIGRAPVGPVATGG